MSFKNCICIIISIKIKRHDITRVISWWSESNFISSVTLMFFCSVRFFVVKWFGELLFKRLALQAWPILVAPADAETEHAPPTGQLHHRHRLSKLSGLRMCQSSGTYKIQMKIQLTRFDRLLWSHGWWKVIPSKKIVYVIMRSSYDITSGWDFADTASIV